MVDGQEMGKARLGLTGYAEKRTESYRKKGNMLEKNEKTETDKSPKRLN